MMGIDSPVSIDSLTTHDPSTRTASHSMVNPPRVGSRRTSPGTSSTEDKITAKQQESLFRCCWYNSGIQGGKLKVSQTFNQNKSEWIFPLRRENYWGGKTNTHIVCVLHPNEKQLISDSLKRGTLYCRFTLMLLAFVIASNSVHLFLKPSQCRCFPGCLFNCRDVIIHWTNGFLPHPCILYVSNIFNPSWFTK